MKHRMLKWIIVVFVGVSLQSHAGWKDVVSAIQNGSDEKALKELDELLEAYKKSANDEQAKRDSKNKELTNKESLDVSNLIITKILIQNRLGKKIDWSQIDSLNVGSSKDFVTYYKAQEYFNENKFAEAEIEFEKVRSSKPNFKLYTGASLRLVDSLIHQKKWKAASTFLIKLQKRMRGEKVYPEVLYKILQVDLAQDKVGMACKWARMLYAKYPFNDVVNDWGPDLHLEVVSGKKLGCVADTEDLERRIRNFQLAGKSKRALAEINLLKSRNTKKSFEIDSVYARYLMQEGDLKEALDLLLGYYNEYKDNTKYLMFLAQVSARAGEIPLSIGSFDVVAKREPKSKNGVLAMFQAAFMSYQSRDYDGATRRFNELLKKAPVSMYTVDAQWHLAWLQYLKGDFSGALKGFQEILNKKHMRPRKFRALQSERLVYWLAMSAYRSGKLVLAKEKFESLVKDGLYGYYAIAAQQRLEALKKVIVTTFRQDIIRRPSGLYMLPSDEIESYGEGFNSEINQFTGSSDQSQEYSDNENSEIVDNNSENAEPSDDDSSNVADVNSDTASDSSTDGQNGQPVPWLPTQELNERLLRARLFNEIGFTDLAKWELFEIEKRTKSQKSMKLLMEEYKTNHSYNRAAYIGQIKFSRDRARRGIDGAKDLWEMTYPRAYQSEVESSAKEDEIPESLIWGIMRAESMYKTDIVSAVGAIGLMQVMPFTGDKMAKLVGIKDFSASNLFQPSVSIKVGSKYLQRLAKKFDFSIPLIAAAYNAGPHRVEQWLYSFGYLDADEFIEHIPYLETRNYVKRVSDNFAIYNKIYKFEQPVALTLNAHIPVFITQTPSLKENWEGI